MLSFTLGASSISVFLDGVFNSIDSNHANYPHLLAELQKPPADRDLAAIRTYITIKSLIEHLSIGRVTVFEDEIQFDGRTVHSYLAERMLEILAQGIDLTPWAAFMDNVFDNPAAYARDELYQWLEKAQMPITPDGCFLAFKKVRKNYRDCHSGLFDNSPGNILEMDRDACDTNRHNTCSSGFHFCSIGYIGNFGGERVVVVKINPKDVTSIPADYNYTKGRCWRYEVVAELDSQSAAYDKCWRKGVVNLENPAELPAGVLSKIKLPDPVVDAPVLADSDPVEEDEMSDHAAVVEDMMTDAGKADVSSFTIPLRPTITFGEDAAAADPVFTTADGREFSASVIKAALEDASIRGAARNLGIQDSTLRGWKKKLGL